MPTNFAEIIPPTATAVPAPPAKPVRRPAINLNPEPTLRATAGPPSTLDPLLTLPEVCKLTTFSRATVYRLISEGKFPAPLKIGPSRIAWLAADLRDFVAQLPRTV